MAKNDLNVPLDREARRKTVRQRPVLAPVLIAAALLIALISAFWVAVVDDPDGGRAVAVANIENAPPPQITRTTGAQDAAPQRDVDRLATLVTMPASTALPSLIELSAFGPLPRVSPDGQRPRSAYAGRAPTGDPSVPRIALVVSGMGLSQTGTQKAIDTLPQDVTLAFAPYGGSLQRWVDMARGKGHEVLLQVPLEPVGYPEENPGEHTLLSSADSRSNDQDLKWVLGRMTSYAGVMNYMGGRFTADDKALASFLGEVGDRGLYYLDDGSSPQSRADAVGESLQVPVAKADLVIDRDRSAASIRRELGALEAIARSRGVAIGVASAFPASIQAINAWAADASARGIVLAPASAALAP